MKLAWATDFTGKGNAYGYSYHSRMMKEYTSKITEPSKDADDVIVILPADRYQRIEGKYNYLFTMFEADRLPNQYLWGVDQADELIVPCSFSRDLFRKYTDKPISVCHEGVNTDFYTYKERTFNPQFDKFKILWVGAPNPRKGYQIMLKLIEVLEKMPNVEVHLKTTVPKVDYSKLNKEKIKALSTGDKQREKRIDNLMAEASDELGIKKQPLHGMFERVGKHKNIIMDCRDLTPEELRDLYHEAHCFILPSFGEGWGLTLSEAMATGLPCIATSMTGTADFFDEYVGYPIAYKMVESYFQYYTCKANVCLPSANHTFELVQKVFQNYKEARKRGRKAAERIRNKFTWDIAAKRLVDIVDNSRSRRGIKDEILTSVN